MHTVYIRKKVRLAKIWLCVYCGIYWVDLYRLYKAQSVSDTRSASHYNMHLVSLQYFFLHSIILFFFILIELNWTTPMMKKFECRMNRTKYRKAVDSTYACWINASNLHIPKHTYKDHTRFSPNSIVQKNSKIFLVFFASIFAVFFPLFQFKQYRFHFHIWRCAKHERVQCLRDKRRQMCFI